MEFTLDYACSNRIGHNKAEVAMNLYLSIIKLSLLFIFSSHAENNLNQSKKYPYNALYFSSVECFPNVYVTIISRDCPESDLLSINPSYDPDGSVTLLEESGEKAIKPRVGINTRDIDKVRKTVTILCPPTGQPIQGSGEQKTLRTIFVDHPVTCKIDSIALDLKPTSNKPTYQPSMPSSQKLAD